MFLVPAKTIFYTAGSLSFLVANISLSNQAGRELLLLAASSVFYFEVWVSLLNVWLLELTTLTCQNLEQLFSPVSDSNVDLIRCVDAGVSDEWNQLQEFNMWCRRVCDPLTKYGKVFFKISNLKLRMKVCSHTRVVECQILYDVIG
ncbi:hypothetical protein O6P43_020425 [Quillaja saponaria]|uniref:Uncharacterized protein n=1 Tax=Quillaja saponaria TaxID=32244 RepID=A0AAD7PM98_QUISA|nr:hypothetical protein O6P43_020425 [Quillaja saponaria]